MVGACRGDCPGDWHTCVVACGGLEIIVVGNDMVYSIFIADL